MEQYDVMILALVLAVQAEIEGMKADNKRKEMARMFLEYGEKEFKEKAEQLRNLAAAHNEQL